MISLTRLKLWIKWESKLVDYFHSVYNTKNIPLSYVIRKDATKEHHKMSHDEQVIYSTALEGPLFDVDTKDVFLAFTICIANKPNTTKTTSYLS